MAWWNRKRFDPQEIAEALYEVAVEESPVQPEHYGVPEDFRSSFLTKLRLYNEALLFAALIEKSNTDKRFGVVLEIYQHMILPRKPTPEGIFKMDQIKNAIDDLNGLIGAARAGASPKTILWGQNWMKTIRFEDTNPIYMNIFSLHWMNMYVAIQESTAKV
jgi:hypothetical protein